MAHGVESVTIAPSAAREPNSRPASRCALRYGRLARMGPGETGIATLDSARRCRQAARASAPSGSVICLVLLLLPTAQAQADIRSATQDVAEMSATSRSLSTDLQRVVGLVPGVALSPSTVFALLAGAGLACEHLPGISDVSACTDPVIADARRATSTWAFVVLVGFALISYLANTGKIQGTFGKALKLLEVAPAVGAYVLVAGRHLGDGAPGTVQSASVFAGFLVVSAAISMCAVMIARLAIELLVWLSPIPFLDLILETTSRVAAVGFIMLWLFYPGLATAVSIAIILLAVACLRWAVHILEFVSLVALKPLVRSLTSRKRRELVDATLLKRHGRRRTVTLAVPVAVLDGGGIRKRAVGALVCVDDALKLYYRSMGRVRVRPVSPRGAEAKRLPWWTELRLREAGPESPSMLAMPRDYAHLTDAICRALGGSAEPNDGHDLEGVPHSLNGAGTGR